jgi:hypothetical protein
MTNATTRPRARLRGMVGHLGCLRGCLLVLLVTLYSGRLPSQTATDEQGQTKLLRFDLAPLFGYRTSITFPTGQDVQQPGLLPSPRLVLDAKPSYGVAFGARLDEENLIEIRWARQNTNVHLEGGAPFPKEKVVLDQFHGDFIHEFYLEEWPRWARPIVIGSIGATHVGGGASNSFTRFSFGLGGGVKVDFTRHLGWKVQAEWLPIVVNPGVGSFVCGGGCVVRLSGTAVSQGEVVMGPVFQF